MLRSHIAFNNAFFHNGNFKSTGIDIPFYFSVYFNIPPGSHIAGYFTAGSHNSNTFTGGFIFYRLCFYRFRFHGFCFIFFIVLSE
ncbi:Uncharacterised protein [Klebsiella pneumoniae]|nr:Uncharacterised protein [Klebsiella pneumoniae]